MSENMPITRAANLGLLTLIFGPWYLLAAILFAPLFRRGCEE